MRLYQKTLPHLPLLALPAVKRELQTANVTARPWSRDIFRFAVCTNHEKKLILKVSIVFDFSGNDCKTQDKLGKILCKQTTSDKRINIPVKKIYTRTLMLLLTETRKSLSLENQQLLTHPSCLLQTASSRPSATFHT